MPGKSRELRNLVPGKFRHLEGIFTAKIKKYINKWREISNSSGKFWLGSWEKAHFSSRVHTVIYCHYLGIWQRERWHEAYSWYQDLPTVNIPSKLWWQHQATYRMGNFYWSNCNDILACLPEIQEVLPWLHTTSIQQPHKEENWSGKF